MEDQSCCVLNLGSDTTKAGLSHNFPEEPEPRVVAPSALLRTHAHANGQHAALANGGSAGSNGGSCGGSGADGGDVLRPVVRGEIVDMDGAEALIHSCLYDHCGWQFAAEGCCVICEPVLTARSAREALTQRMFEVFNVPGLFFQDEASLALFAVGKTSGCVVDIGHAKVDVSTVLEGQLLSSSTRRLDIGMTQLTGLLQQLVQGRTMPPSNTLDWEALARRCLHTADSQFDLERAGQVAATHDASTAKPVTVDVGSAPPRPTGEPITYALPDGQEVTITTEGLQVAEALLRPEMRGECGPTLAESLVSSVSTSYEGNARRVGVESMLVCGGGSSIPGVAHRLLHDVKALATPSLKPGLCAVPDYMPKCTAHFAPWVGGAVVTKILLNQNQFISKWDYEEEGPCAGYRKCL